MKFSALVLPLKIEGSMGNLNQEITSLAYDSRRVSSGAAFVAISGHATDGHRFIPQAIEQGAAAIIAEDLSKVPAGVPAIQVADSRKALATLADLFYDHPSRKLRLFGVTGTNGKTTTTHLIDGIFRTAGKKTGLIGTLYTRIVDEIIPTQRTTPESLDFQETLAKMLSDGVEAVSMEVSSHALALGRTDNACFDAAAFTNLTQDHLDFHKNFENYFAAKMRLFCEYPSCCQKSFTAVVNADDPYGKRIQECCLGDLITYGIREDASLQASEIRATHEGIAFHAKTPAGEVDVFLNLGGVFNVYNALAAMGIGLSQGIDLSTIKVGLESVQGVPGRVEIINAGQSFSVLVDYAHTPDGLENVISSLAKLKEEGRKIVVFGCGGDRDKTKRPVMGRIAVTLGDRVIVTSDNPRTEDPNAIIQDILAGIEPSFHDKLTVEPDRALAIRKAISMAEPGDVVLIAGKGHETYQIFADQTIHFDDREVAREALKERGFTLS